MYNINYTQQLQKFYIYIWLLNSRDMINTMQVCDYVIST